MAFNKNFVVKNGIEIATDLIYATNESDKVGFGTTLPTSKVDVIGDVTAYGSVRADSGSIIATHDVKGTNSNFTGITTVINGFNVGTSGTALKVIVGSSSSIGINTSLPAYPLDVRGSASIGQTAAHLYGDLIVTGNITGNSFDGQVTVGGTLSFSDLTVTGILTAKDEEVYTQFDIINNGSAAYQYQSTGIGFTVNRDDPAIFLIRGKNYRFNVNATGYPFYIKTAPITGTGSRFDRGVEGNGKQVGIITFRVPFDAPRELYYQASNQAGMGSTIYILKESEPLPTGISTTQLVVENINATGVTTLTDLNVVNATVTGVATVANFSNLVTSGNLSVTGISTLTGSIIVSNGINVTGTGTFSNSVRVGSSITANSTGINVIGIVTATSFTGSGTGITGLTNSNLSGTAGITNGNLANSTISGISLGGTLNTLTLATSGTGLSGSQTYNGSTGVTFTVTSNATANDDANTIVARNASGNFNAGTITASLNGTASNANTLDNFDSSQFLRSDVGDQKTSGTLRFDDNVILSLGNGDDAEFFHDGSNTYIDLNIGNLIIRDTTSTRFTFADAGHFTATGNIQGVNITATGDFNSTSDIRLKTNIKTLTNSLDKVLQMRGVEYDRIDLNEKHQIGVIAQEVEQIFPDLVSTNEEGVKSVSYGNITAVLIEAVKELTARVKELESRNS